MKRVLSVFTALLLVAVLPVTAFAGTWVGMDFTMEAPDNLYQLGPYLAEDDAAWALAGIASVQDKLQEYKDMGVLVNFLSEDKSTDINVMQKESDTTKSIYNLQLLDEDEKAKFLDELIQSDNELVSMDKTWHPVGDYLFYRVKLDVAAEDADSTDMHELLFGTVINGYGLNFDIHTTGVPITPEQEQILQGIVDSVTFTNVTEKPEADPTDAANLLLLLALMVCAVAGPLIYIPIRRRYDKKKKARLAEQLSAYHKTHGNDTVVGEPLFVNATDCTKEAIHKFSMHQAYVKNLGEVVFGTLLCVVMLATAFLVDAEWWVRIAVVAVSGYYVYKLIAMPGEVEKVQTKVYGRGMSSTAHYTFYPEAFRVSGVQSASVLPYFQITDVHKSGQYLYLYYGPDNAYMVDQYGFTQGDFDSFERFIRDKVEQNKK